VSGLTHWHEWPDDASPLMCHHCYRPFRLGDRFVVCRIRFGGWGILGASPAGPGCNCFDLLGDPAGAIGYVRVAVASPNTRRSPSEGERHDR
jgi:hypothetical protein